MATAIQYPYALDPDGNLVRVRDGASGREYTCLSCGKPMLFRRGQRMSPHFAHRISASECSPDRAFQVMGKHVVSEALKQSLSGRRVYEVYQKCLGCTIPVRAVSVSLNLNQEVLTDFSLSGSANLQIGIFENRRPLTLFEVIDSLSPRQLNPSHYGADDIPVYIHIFTGSEDLERLNERFLADNSVNVRQSECPECVAQRIAQAEPVVPQEEQDSIIEEGVSDISSLPFKPWVKDARGRLIRAKTRKRIYATAIILTELGFEQSERTGSERIFTYRYPDHLVLANFGAKYQPPIWVEPSPLLHGVGGDRIEISSPDLFSEIAARCRSAGAEIVVPKKYKALDPLSNGQEVDPLQRVDPNLLDRLCETGSYLFEQELSVGDSDR